MRCTWILLGEIKRKDAWQIAMKMRTSGYILLRMRCDIQALDPMSHEALLFGGDALIIVEINQRKRRETKR